jgi:hypothetical protein
MMSGSRAASASMLISPSISPRDAKSSGSARPIEGWGPPSAYVSGPKTPATFTPYSHRPPAIVLCATTTSGGASSVCVTSLSSVNVQGESAQSVPPAAASTDASSAALSAALSPPQAASARAAATPAAVTSRGSVRIAVTIGA